MFGQRLDVTQTPLLNMPSPNGATPPRRLRTCFLSSEARPNSESRVTVIGHNSEHEAAMVEALVFDYGWSVGADFELLPPASFVRRVSA